MFWHLTGYYLTMTGRKKGTGTSRGVGCLLFSSSCLLSKDANETAAEVSPSLLGCSLLAVQVEGKGFVLPTFLFMRTNSSSRIHV